MGRRPAQLMVIIAFVVVLLVGVCVPAWGQEQVRLVVNGREVQSDVPSQVIDGRTMVPLGALAEALGAGVGWDEGTSTVFVNNTAIAKQPEREHAITNLVRVLNKLNTGAWTSLYLRDKFDCSNMSALLDFTLDTMGFQSYILSGNLYKLDPRKAEFKLFGGHAAVLVFCENSIGITCDPWWVESTTLQVFPANGLVFAPGKDFYFFPTQVYTTAEEAFRRNPREFTWTLEDVKRVFDSIPLK